VRADIDLTVSYPHPPQRVWQALTSSEALATWLMPNDFKPVVGHRFTLQARPRPLLGFNNIVRCEVIELDPPRRMTWSLTRRILGNGWPGLLQRRLLASLDQLAGASASTGRPG
jgi:uncharacterized protein YndB with AHSA1/START domain